MAALRATESSHTCALIINNLISSTVCLSSERKCWKIRRISISGSCPGLDCPGLTNNDCRVSTQRRHVVDCQLKSISQSVAKPVCGHGSPLALRIRDSSSDRVLEPSWNSIEIAVIVSLSVDLRRTHVWLCVWSEKNTDCCCCCEHWVNERLNGPTTASC